MCVCVYIYIYIYILTELFEWPHRARRAWMMRGRGAGCSDPCPVEEKENEGGVSLYTILSLPIVYGVWHQQGGSGGGGGVVYCTQVARQYCSSVGNVNGRGY